MPVYRLAESLAFPDPEKADESGVLAFGGDLRPERLLLAYENGIFPWFSEGDPLLWWSPEQRMVLHLNELKVSKSMKKALRDNVFEIRFDSDFASVIEACSHTPRAGQDGTWITPDMMEAYIALHQQGFAHSVETWINDELVGGLYGLSMGRAFFGESMFSRVSEASKVALFHLHEFAVRQQFHFIDCQVHNDHLASLGAREIPRNTFLKQLKRALAFPDLRGSWAQS